MNTFCQTLSTAAILLATSSVFAGTIPPATGTALDGHKITLPDDLPGRASILILGFSKNSQNTTTAWEIPIRKSLAATPAIGYLDIPFLEDAPSLIRPIILRGIRKQVPDILKPNFVPLTSGEAAWKQAATFTPSAPDAAYVLLVDKSGTIRWQTHAPYTPALFDQLTQAAKKLSAEAK
jgi:hypothetical protein